MENAGDIKNLRTEDQFARAIRKGITLVQFYQFGNLDNEFACTMIKDLPQDYPELKVYRLDFNEVMMVPMSYRCQTMPTACLFKDSRLMGKVEGVKELELRHLIEKTTGQKPG